MNIVNLKLPWCFISVVFTHLKKSQNVKTYCKCPTKSNSKVQLYKVLLPQLTRGRLTVHTCFQVAGDGRSNHQTLFASPGSFGLKLSSLATPIQMDFIFISSKKSYLYWVAKDDSLSDYQAEFK